MPKIFLYVFPTFVSLHLQIKGSMPSGRFNPPHFFSFHSDESIKKAVGEFFNLVSFDEQDVRPEDMHQQTMLLQKVN